MQVYGVELAPPDDILFIALPVQVPMAVIELVDRNPEAKKIDKPKKTETKDKTKAPKAEPKVANK